MSFSIEHIRQVAREHIAAKYGTQVAAAKAYGVTCKQLSQALTGRVSFPDWLLMEIGFKRLVTYERAQPSCSGCACCRAKVLTA